MDEPRLGRRSLLQTTGALAGADAPSFPDVTLSAETDAAVYTAGQTARVDLTVEAASDEALVRDRLPDGWTAVGGDPHTTAEVEGSTYVEFDASVAAGDTVTYFADDAPEESNEYVFGPAEYSDEGRLWATADGTTRTVYVVGLPA